ncbi:MAG: hypothetical protein JNK12_12090 [Acidimicrobiales bacterium]|nr:hypothetical protein [Acidimicrobiales bacterium]
MLDAEALRRLAHGRRAQQAELIAALKAMTDGVEVEVLTSSAVLAELLDGKRDVGVWSALRRHQVDRREVDDDVATRAGHLLTEAEMDSSNAVDAFVAATAALRSPAIVVTVDVADLRALTADLPDVTVYSI